MGDGDNMAATPQTILLPAAFDGLKIEIQNHTGVRMRYTQYKATWDPVERKFLCKIYLYEDKPQIKKYEPAG